MLDFLSLDHEGPKVVTYQCLCRVQGQLRFRLENSGDPAVVYDEVSVGPGGGTDGFTAPTLVTLRVQRKASAGTGATTSLRIENSSGGEASLKVVWQHAWTGGGDDGTFTMEDGLRNFAQVRTPTGEETENTYVWGVNATSVKAVQRFQLPLKGEAFGWLAATPSGMDLNEGEVYYDSDQEGAICRSKTDTWYMLFQPERFLSKTDTSISWTKGTEKNIQCTSAGTTVQAVSVGASGVVTGTVVRVFCRQSNISPPGVTVTTSTHTFTLSNQHMLELVFDGSVWVCTQFNVAVL